jgi:predicted CXXCH cytochrome family protein
VTKHIVGLFAAFALSTVALAAVPTGPTVLPAKNGNVTFEHAKHAKLDCTKCHADAKGGKIEGFGKEKAHATCVECHKTASEGKGPTKCADCHKKA